MTKSELRNELIQHGENFGNVNKELAELKKFQDSADSSDIITITVGCSELLTLICC